MFKFKLVTKTKADGSIVIDKNRSFLALIEALKAIYDEGFVKAICDEVSVDENDFIRECRRYWRTQIN